MKNFDINSFLNESFKKYSDKTKAKPKISSNQIPQSNNTIINPLTLQTNPDQVLNNLIDNTIYDKLNIASLNDNMDIETIIKPLFPNDKVYTNEFIPDKVFILEKFIKPKVKKEKHPKKTNFTKSLIKTLKQSSLTYDSIKHMTVLWEEYIASLMNNATNPDIIGDKFLKADLHGALIEVISATNKNTIGIKGILLLETKKTFNLISHDNSLKTILKQGTIFKINLPYGNICINLIGNNFIFKSSERTKIKFKNHYCLNKELFSIYTNTNTNTNSNSNY